MSRDEEYHTLATALLQEESSAVNDGTYRSRHGSATPRQLCEILSVTPGNAGEGPVFADASFAASNEAGAYPCTTHMRDDKDDLEPLTADQSKHYSTDRGCAVNARHDIHKLQLSEAEPLHFPGAVQSFGILLALEEQKDRTLAVRIVSENAEELLGYTSEQLFALKGLTDILPDEQAHSFWSHVLSLRHEDTAVFTNGAKVFRTFIRLPSRQVRGFWCAMHINERNAHLIICEFEPDDRESHRQHADGAIPEPSGDCLFSGLMSKDMTESTRDINKPFECSVAPEDTEAKMPLWRSSAS